jgi:hypothetical protein
MEEIFVVDQWILNKNGNTQIKQIGSELLNSLNIWLNQNPDKQHNKHFYIERIGDLIFDLRLGRTDPNGFGEFGEHLEHPDSFLKSIDNFTGDKKKELKEAYDRVWVHSKIMDLILNAKLDWGALPYLSNEQLESVAQTYTINPWMQSPLLEWLLIDALLFNETVAYAKMLPNLPVQKYFLSLFRSFLKLTRLLLSEGFFLALTAFVSNLIDETHGIAFWIIFATITLGRWLHPIKAQGEIERQKSKRLLADMLSVHERLYRIDFNARLLRDLLYNLENRGTVYSHALFNVLDKRIARG